MPAMAGAGGSIYGGRSARRLRRLAKQAYHLGTAWRDRPESLLLIVGCQRSGTTLMSRIFERDINTSVYKERSRLSSLDQPKQLRLNPIADVKSSLSRDKAPFVVLKPLVESQNVVRLLNKFEGSRALWMYRHHKDVASSYVNKWGPTRSIKDLTAMTSGQPNWRSEHVSSEVMEIVNRLFTPAISPHDASALYWYVRNRFVVDLDLAADPRVTFCRYESLVRDPDKEMRRIYDHIGRDYPGPKILSEVTARRVGGGSDVDLSPELDNLCRELLESLDSVAP